MLLMSEFDEALDFMQEAFTQPSMSPVLNECKLYCRQFHKQLKIADEQSRREEKPPPAAILAVLPSRGRCAQFVNLYFEYFENTYRILHVPLFMRDYNLFWDAENDRATRFYSFIPQLAAVVAIMASLDWDGDETMGERPLGGRLSTMIEDWLRYPDKNLTPTAILRIRCLLLLARLTGVDLVKRPYSTTSGSQPGICFGSR